MHTAQYCNCVHTTYYYLVCRYNYIQAQIIFLFIYIPLLKQFLKNEWIQIIKFHKNVKVTQSEIVSFFVHSNFSQLCPFHGVYSFIYYWTVRSHSITTWTRWGGRGSKNVCFVYAQGINLSTQGGVCVKKSETWPVQNENTSIQYE